MLNYKYHNLNYTLNLIFCSQNAFLFVLLISEKISVQNLSHPTLMEISIFQMTSQLSWEKPAMQITCTVICWWPPATGFIVQLSIMHQILSPQSLLQFFSYTNCVNCVKVGEGILLSVTFYSVHSLCTLFFSWTSSCSWISCGCSQPRSARPMQGDTILGNSTGLCVHFHWAMVLRIQVPWNCEFSAVPWIVGVITVASSLVSDCWEWKLSLQQLFISLCNLGKTFHLTAWRQNCLWLRDAITSFPSYAYSLCGLIQVVFSIIPSCRLLKSL